MDGDEDIFRPAGMGGEGWWDDAQKEVKRVAKRVHMGSPRRKMPRHFFAEAIEKVVRGAEP